MHRKLSSIRLFKPLGSSSKLTSLLLIVITTLMITGCGVLLPGTESSADAAYIPTPTIINAQKDEVPLTETTQMLADQASLENPGETAINSANDVLPQEESNLPTDTSPATNQSPSPQEDSPPSKMPADIPVPEGKKENLFSSANFLSYSTEDSFSYLTSYYEKKMADYEWSKIESGSYITESTAQFTYEKPDRKAIVNIQVNLLSQHVTVVITIQGK